MNKIFAALAVLTVSSFSLAGPAGGTIGYRGTLSPGETHDQAVVLNGGQESVRIRAVGSVDGGDIDCALMDHDHDIVAQDMDATNLCLIQGAVRTRALFYVRVKNNGSQTQSFVVVVDSGE